MQHARRVRFPEITACQRTIAFLQTFWPLYHDGAGPLGKLDAWYFTRREWTRVHRTTSVYSGGSGGVGGISHLPSTYFFVPFSFFAAEI